MPGKVNPTQCEAMTMVCAQVIGNDVAVGIGGASRQLRAERLQAADHPQRAALDAAPRPTPATRSTSTARGASSPTATRIRRTWSSARSCWSPRSRPDIGYDKAAKIAKKAHAEGLTLKEAAVELGYLTAEEFDREVRPESMVG